MKTRIISAIVLIVLFVPILIIGKVPYIVLGSVLSLMGLWELLRLKKVPLFMQIISYIFCLFIVISSFIIKDFNPFNYYLLVGMFLLYSIIMLVNSDLSKYSYQDCLWLFIVTIIIGFMFKNFIDVRVVDSLKLGSASNLFTVIYLFLISVMTDTFALFCGKAFGKHKLIPKVSPNKTIEGSIGGSIIGTIIPVVFIYLVTKDISVLFVVETFILTIISQFGDLFFSSIKRNHDIKDFSNLIPGHGGILDRLDSILFVVNAYIIMINIL